MAFVMPEVALQRLVQIGLSNLRVNRAAFNCIFAQFLTPEMSGAYGQQHIDKIYNWFVSSKLPVLQAWSFDPTRVPAYSVHLADESEDESKAAISDFYGEGEDGDINVNCFNVTVDVGCHGSKTSDQVLWLYYILGLL